MLSPELNALLAGLHRDPADDALWLVASDWLEEAGRAGQAELLRLHLLLRGPSGEPGRADLEERAIALLAGGERPCVPEIVNSIGMRLALIPAGTFLMGSPDDEKGRYSDEGPRHQVHLSRPCWMGVHHVTQSQWQAVRGTNPSHFCGEGKGREAVRGHDTSCFPVDNLSWEDAAAYCKSLSGLPAEQAAGRVYNLPTEAEWERACRAGIYSHPFHFGPSIGPKQANFEGSGLRRTCPVGRYAPNVWGLFDMHGQVWQWCDDSLSRFRGGARHDPRVATDDDASRILRGGSWSATPAGCRASFRGSISPELRTSYYGLRVCCRAA